MSKSAWTGIRVPRNRTAPESVSGVCTSTPRNSSGMSTIGGRKGETAIPAVSPNRETYATRRERDSMNRTQPSGARTDEVRSTSSPSNRTVSR